MFSKLTTAHISVRLKHHIEQSQLGFLDMIAFLVLFWMHFLVTFWFIHQGRLAELPAGCKPR